MRDNNDYFEDEVSLEADAYNKTNSKKPHVVRRSIEDLLEQQALKKRLKDIYDDDFLKD